jgi:hypothetical protein
VPRRRWPRCAGWRVPLARATLSARFATLDHQPLTRLFDLAALAPARLATLGGAGVRGRATVRAVRGAAGRGHRDTARGGGPPRDRLALVSAVATTRSPRVPRRIPMPDLTKLLTDTLAAGFAAEPPQPALFDPATDLLLALVAPTADRDTDDLALHFREYFVAGQVPPLEGRRRRGRARSVTWWRQRAALATYPGTWPMPDRASPSTAGGAQRRRGSPGSSPATCCGCTSWSGWGCSRSWGALVDDYALLRRFPDRVASTRDGGGRGDGARPARRGELDDARPRRGVPHLPGLDLRAGRHARQRSSGEPRVLDPSSTG